MKTLVYHKFTTTLLILYFRNLLDIFGRLDKTTLLGETSTKRNPSWTAGIISAATTTHVVALQQPTTG